jgi:hypothetical protein
VKDREIDEILERAAQGTHKLDPTLLERVAGAIKPSLHPVRPLPPTWLLVAGMVLVCAAVAVAGAARAGFYGIEKLTLFDRALIFPALAILAGLTGIEFVAEMIPGSRRRMASGTLLGINCLLLVGMFALLFRDYQTDHFVHAGIACLAVGVLHAVPAALLGWLLLRRGFAVNPIAAGLVVGTFAGLAGVGMLELHCANLQALHILIWHTAVVPVSGAIGALVAWAFRVRR